GSRRCRDCGACRSSDFSCANRAGICLRAACGSWRLRAQRGPSQPERVLGISLVRRRPAQHEIDKDGIRLDRVNYRQRALWAAMAACSCWRQALLLHWLSCCESLACSAWHAACCAVWAWTLEV